MSQQPPDPYGRRPPPPPGPTQQPPGKAPPEVRWAAGLMIAAGLLGLLYVVLARSYASYFLATTRQSVNQYEQGLQLDAEKVAFWAIVLTGVSCVILIAFWIWWAIMVRLGRNWARILATIFAALYVTSDLLSYLFGPVTRAARVPTYATIMDLTILLVMTAGAILAWSRPASTWFRARKAWRRRKRHPTALGRR